MAAADTFVVDASLVAELFLPGPASEAARNFFLDVRGRYTLIAPKVIVSEVAAAITRGVRRGALDPRGARAAYSDWQQMLQSRLIAVMPDDDLLASAFDLSLRLHHPLHDCVYVALALSQSASIAMCDAVLARKCRALGLKAEALVS